MEARGEVEPGSVAKLRKEAKEAENHALKAVQMLANAVAPVVNLDMFSSRTGTPGVDDIDALTKKPVLIVCADEERKQFLCSFQKSTFC